MTYYFFKANIKYKAVHTSDCSHALISADNILITIAYLFADVYNSFKALCKKQNKKNADNCPCKKRDHVSFEYIVFKDKHEGRPKAP